MLFSTAGATDNTVPGLHAKNQSFLTVTGTIGSFRSQDDVVTNGNDVALLCVKVFKESADGTMELSPIFRHYHTFQPVNAQYATRDRIKFVDAGMDLYACVICGGFVANDGAMSGKFPFARKTFLKFRIVVLKTVFLKVPREIALTTSGLMSFFECGSNLFWLLVFCHWGHVYPHPGQVVAGPVSSDSSWGGGSGGPEASDDGWIVAFAAASGKVSGSEF